MDLYDVAIVGGGVVGTAIARELSRFKLSVALIEKEEELAFGVSKSNSGIIHPGTQHPPNSLKGRLCVQGNLLTRRISKDLGVDFKEVGELVIAFTGEEMPILLNLKKDGEALGVPGLEMVDRAWLRKNEPNLTGDCVGALYAPTAGIISPYRWAYDMSENAAKNGIEIYAGTKVEKILYHRDSNNSKTYFEICASTRTFKSKYLINAAGLYADNISRMAGVDNFRITPRKGEEFLLDKKREHLTKHLLFPIPSKVSKGVLIIKTADGNPMIGPTAEDVEDKENLSTTDEGLAKVFKSARKMIPTIDESDIIAYFAGLRPVAGDDFIIRHEDKVRGLINVAGIQSPGLTAAPAIALMVCGLLKDNGLTMKRKLIFHKYRKKTEHIFADPVPRIHKLIKKDHSYGDIICRCETVSAKEIKDAIKRGARTLDGIKFRTRAQAGRCHGSFCTTRLMKILAEETKEPLTKVTKRGKGSEIVKKDRACD